MRDASHRRRHVIREIVRVIVPTRASLFITCLNDTLFPQTGRAVVTLLERLGLAVDFPREQTCCGQMHFNTGYAQEAIPLVRHFVRAFADAEVVVSGGRGVGSAEGFTVIEELAELLRAAVGCSRAVTSAGWRPHSDQVGQTGTKISPEIYIACGISGATQHMAGCKGAKKLLAINPDREASIFASADYGVIGDLHEVVPAISEQIRKARGA